MDQAIRTQTYRWDAQVILCPPLKLARCSAWGRLYSVYNCACVCVCSGSGQLVIVLRSKYHVHIRQER